MPPKPLFLAVIVLALTACDSGLAYKADLGQSGAGPMATATKTGAPSASGQLYTLASAGSDTLAPDLSRIQVGGAFLPLSPNPGTVVTYAFVVPYALGFTPPTDANAHAYALIENSGLATEHATLAQVTFK